MKAKVSSMPVGVTMLCLGSWRYPLLLLVLVGMTCHTIGGPLQLVSSLGPTQTPPADGGGDAYAPIISPDGRYVLFASTANNLTLINSNSPLPLLIPARVNVFLRNRTMQSTTLVSVNLSRDRRW